MLTRMARMFYAEDDGGGTGGGATGTTEELDAILSGRIASGGETGGDKPKEKQFTEGSEGDGDGQQKPAEKAKADSEDKEGDDADKQGSEQKPEDIEKDVESKLFGSGKPEEEAKRLKRLYEASSKEGVRLSKQLQKINELLEKQGVEALIDNGEVVGFVARKGAKGQAEPSMSFKDMPDDVKELFDIDPEKAVEWVWAKAKSAFARVEPSADVVVPISEERVAAAVEALAEETEMDGETKSYPDIQEKAKLAVKFINGTGAPRELKNLYYRSPELALKLVASFIDSRKAAAQAMVQRELAKKNKAKDHPDLGPSKTNTATAIGKQYQDEMGKAIAGAPI